MRCRYVLLCIQTLLSCAIATGQTGAPVEVMPLHVGNAWTYNYTLNTLDQSRAASSDSGIVRCDITDCIQAPDSIRWVVAQHRNLLLSYHNWPMILRDTSFTVRDSSTFEIVERLEGLHQLYRNQTEGYIGVSVFPWGRDLTDTASVNRYAYVDSADVARFETCSSVIPYSFIYIFRFKRGLGEQQVQARTSQYYAGGIAVTNHTLLEAVITSARDGSPEALHDAPFLSQNYPNPFNPSTTITYGLPHRSTVSLIVYNVLGEQVAILARGEQEAGFHELRFDGSLLASGVYFCRLKAGDRSITKRLLLLR